MKLLVWSQYFWPEHFVINDFCLELARQGVEVTVLTGKPNYPEGKVFKGFRAWGCSEEQLGQIPVKRVPLVPRGSGSSLRLAANYLSFIASSFLFSKSLLRRNQHDVVLVYAVSPLLQAISAILFAKARRIPVVIWVQDLWPESLESTGRVNSALSLRLVRNLVRWIYQNTDMVLVPSRAFFTSIQAQIRRDCPLLLVPNAIDDPLSNLSKVSMHPDWEEALASTFSVVFAGNIGSVQSCETILEAAKLLRSQVRIRFFIFGAGSSLTRLQTIADRDNITNVSFCGRVSPEEIPRLLHQSSALLLTLADDPSLNRTVPSKLQTYFAMGKPIIVSANGETSRLLEASGAGISCPAQDPEALASAVLKLSQLPISELEAIGKSGRTTYEQQYALSPCVAVMKESLNSARVKN